MTHMKKLYQKLTNLLNLKVRDSVNIEFDVLGKYIKNFIKK